MSIQSQVNQLLLEKMEAENRRITQRQAAKEIGISIRTLERLIHNRVERIERGDLEKVRTYFGRPGEVKIHLGDLIKAAGVTYDEVAQNTGYSIHTISRCVMDDIDRIEMPVMAGFCKHFQLDDLEQLIDTGGVFVWMSED